MTQPAPAPTPTTLERDQAVLNASMALIRAELAPQRDEQRIAQLHAAYQQALTARWPNA